MAGRSDEEWRPEIGAHQHGDGDSSSDLPGAERTLAKAIELNPGFATSVNLLRKLLQGAMIYDSVVTIC